jgi:hypothetical protein
MLSKAEILNYTFGKVAYASHYECAFAASENETSQFVEPI